ncbi:MAG: hypothetical protein KGJ02_02455 [Verrucomicrobiota bacterium]|nr:hypothetical protein [Verrucomicrobiota bacterium]
MKVFFLSALTLSLFAAEPLPIGLFPAAYNAPAAIETEHRWFFDASFLYWYVQQEGMDLAITSTMETTGANVLLLAADSVPLFQSFQYSPAFRVGTGFRFGSDQWLLSADYTRLRQKTQTSSRAFASDLSPGTGVGEWVMTGWYLQTATSSGQSLAASQVNSKWVFGFDLFNLCLSRPYYEGYRLTLTPSFGLQGALIREQMHITARIMNATPPQQPVVSANLSQSWGLGPTGALQSQWLLGYGLRLEADCSASFLFTQYNKVSHREDPGNLGDTQVGASLSYYNCLRSLAQGGLGFGWSSYWKKPSYHFDFLATYDFTILWSQNMMRALVELNRVGIGLTPQNLYLHGLTFSSRFDF